MQREREGESRAYNSIGCLDGWLAGLRKLARTPPQRDLVEAAGGDHLRNKLAFQVQVYLLWKLRMRKREMAWTKARERVSQRNHSF